MDHNFTEEERLIGDTARDLFAKHFPIADLRKILDAGESPRLAGLAIGEAGLLGVCAPLAIDGGELGALGALPIIIAAGNRLVPYPVADSIAAAALLADRHPSLAQAAIAGRKTVVFPASQISPLESDGRQLHGRVNHVPWALSADYLLVQALLPAGLRHVLIDLAKAEVTRGARKSIDPSFPLGQIMLDQVVVGEADVLAAGPEWRRLRVILAAGELLGAAQACLTMAIDYMKLRKQFGQEIGRFQALKHIAANGALSIECMRVAAEYAAWSHDSGGEDADCAASIAKSYASEHARRVAEDAMQCHGAIGFTWDYDLHFYLRRILRLGAGLGTAAVHREEIAGALGRRLSMEDA